MPKYIDADLFKLKIKRWRDLLTETYGKNDEYVRCLEEVLMRLDCMKAADVVEKERYAQLLANAIIVCEALKQYQTGEKPE